MIMKYSPHLTISETELHMCIYKWHIRRFFRDEFDFKTVELDGLIDSIYYHHTEDKLRRHSSFIYKRIWMYVETVFAPKRNVFKIKSYTLMFLPQKLCLDSS